MEIDDYKKNGMKLLLISTPRSGNTWLRMMLADLYQLEQFAEHTPDALDWNQLPARSIVQLHWERTPEFTAQLAEAGFEALTIARHPLDVLLSILQFAAHEPQTAMWLSARGGNEDAIHGKDAGSEEFHAYATGPRAASLLSVTPQWWNVPGGLQVRYEELVRDPEEALAAVIGRYGPPLKAFDQVLPAITMDKLRAKSTNNHFWKGSPGHWKSLMARDLVAAIGQAHSGVFEQLGYDWSQPASQAEALALELAPV